jgi:hypothetical protein
MYAQADAQVNENWKLRVGYWVFKTLLSHQERDAPSD